MEGSFDVGEDSSQAAQLMMTGRVVLRMEWLVPADHWLSADEVGRGKGTLRALQETEGEVERAAGVKQDGSCLLVSSLLGISNNLPLVLL